MDSFGMCLAERKGGKALLSCRAHLLKAPSAGLQGHLHEYERTHAIYVSRSFPPPADSGLDATQRLQPNRPQREI